MSEHPENQYLDLLRDCLENGERREGRNGVTYGLFGRQIRFDLSQGFPLLTTKRVHWKSIVVELLFFLRGYTNRNWLSERGVTIWDEWGDSNGNLGPIYSHQWRNFGGRPDNIPQPQPNLPENVTANYLGVASTDGFRSSSIADTVDQRLFQAWKVLIARCYDRQHDAYPYYGQKGVHVCDQWLRFSNFRREVKELDGWSEKLAHWDEYQLDKDILGTGFRYSLETCTWASRADNQRAKYHQRHYLVHDSGETAVIDNPVVFYTERGLHQGNFCAMLRGERPVAQGWRLQWTQDRWAGVDQVANVIDGLKRDPYGRRHIVTAWNPGEIDQMALPPCHCLFQFFVANGKLSCQLYQRSADIFLGVPFNIASYALLTHLIALEVGLEVGDFIHTFGDVHLYGNHVDQAREQLSRQPRPMPFLHIARHAVDDISQYPPHSIVVCDYDPYPAIKAEVSV